MPGSLAGTMNSSVTIFGSVAAAVNGTANARKADSNPARMAHLLRYPFTGSAEARAFSDCTESENALQVFDLPRFRTGKVLPTFPENALAEECPRRQPGRNGPSGSTG